MYDFGARKQDMQLGRWWQIDPLADKSAFESPYSYAGNNPVLFIDDNGKLKTNYNRTELRKKDTDQDINAFTTIVKNVDNLLSANPQIMTVMMNTTGLSKTAN